MRTTTTNLALDLEVIPANPYPFDLIGTFLIDFGSAVLYLNLRN